MRFSRFTHCSILLQQLLTIPLAFYWVRLLSSLFSDHPVAHSLVLRFWNGKSHVAYLQLWAAWWRNRFFPLPVTFFFPFILSFIRNYLPTVPVHNEPSETNAILRGDVPNRRCRWRPLLVQHRMAAAGTLQHNCVPLRQLQRRNLLQS